MANTRNEVVKIAQKYVGCKQYDSKHKDLVNTFNQVKPHGEVAYNSSAWCAITWTAVQIKAGNDQKVVPYSYNCGTLITYAKKLGIWVEDDNYLPLPGDGILYDWDDNGKGDCTGAPDHVGIVESVEGNEITIIEGNKGTSASCGRRIIKRNGRYIRGYICPKYDQTKKTYSGAFPKGVLKYGASGEEVKNLQRFLNWAISAKLKIDGKWGDATEKAVNKFCVKVGLIKSGEKGKIVWGSKCLKKAKGVTK